MVQMPGAGLRSPATSGLKYQQPNCVLIKPWSSPWCWSCSTTTAKHLKEDVNADRVYNRTGVKYRVKAAPMLSLLYQWTSAISRQESVANRARAHGWFWCLCSHHSMTKLTNGTTLKSWGTSSTLGSTHSALTAPLTNQTNRKKTCMDLGVGLIVYNHGQGCVKMLVFVNRWYQRKKKFIIF